LAERLALTPEESLHPRERLADLPLTLVGHRLGARQITLERLEPSLELALVHLERALLDLHALLQGRGRAQPGVERVVEEHPASLLGQVDLELLGEPRDPAALRVALERALGADREDARLVDQPREVRARICR